MEFILSFQKRNANQLSKVQSEKNDDNTADAREPDLNVVGYLFKNRVEKNSKRRKNKRESQNKKDAVGENFSSMILRIIEGRSCQIRQESRDNRQYARSEKRNNSRDKRKENGGVCHKRFSLRALLLFRLCNGLFLKPPAV